jgi:hypothetical protein
MSRIRPECPDSEFSGPLLVADVLVRNDPDEDEDDEEEDDGELNEDGNEGANEDEGYSE